MTFEELPQFEVVQIGQSEDKGLGDGAIYKRDSNERGLDSVLVSRIRSFRLGSFRFHQRRNVNGNSIDGGQ